MGEINRNKNKTISLGVERSDSLIYLDVSVNKEGKIEDTFSSFTKPLSNKIINKIESIL